MGCTSSSSYDMPWNRNITNRKVVTESEAQKIFADSNLRTAITHPTIQAYLREYNLSQGRNNNKLDFFMSAEEIRALSSFKGKEIENQKFKMVADLVEEYLMDRAEKRIEVTVRHTLIRYSQQIKTLNSALTNLKFAQDEVYEDIKEQEWLQFVESNEYTELLRKKEIRTLISLFRSQKTVEKSRKKSTDLTERSLRSICSLASLGGEDRDPRFSDIVHDIS